MRACPSHPSVCRLVGASTGIIKCAVASREDARAVCLPGCGGGGLFSRRENLDLWKCLTTVFISEVGCSEFSPLFVPIL